MDKTPILDISSDDEVGFDDSSTADNFDWISKLFEDDPVGDDVNCKSSGLFDCIDDSDDVVVVGEVVPKQKKAKIWLPRYLDDDDDCVVLDCDPDKPATAEAKNSDGDSDELLIVGEKGQVACRDYPHSRHLCAKFPFSSTSHESRCDLCHCYVCDSLAPCSYWGSGLSSIDHCHANDKEECWQLERKKVRQSKNSPVPITKPPAAAMVRLPQLPQNSARSNQVRRTPSTCGVSSSFGRPNIISQGRSQTPSINVARTRFQPHLVSQQLFRACNSSSQSNRGSTLISSRPIFKRCGLTARPVLTNNSVYGSPNHTSVAHLQQLLNHQLAGKPIESNLNVNTCQPTAISTTTSGLSSELPGFSQPSHTLMSGFQGCGIPSAVTSDSLYVCTSVNQTQNVSSPNILQYSSDAPNCVTQSSQQPSVMTHNVTGPMFHCDTSNVPNNISGSIEQPSEATINLSSPRFPCHTSNSLNRLTQSCQQPSAQNSPVQGAIHQPSNSLNSVPQNFQQPSVNNLQVQGALPLHELLSPTEQNPQLSGSTNSSTLDLDFDSWLSDNEPIIGAQDGSFFCDMNNQSSVTASVDADMLYFDFKTSWKGLTRLEGCPFF